MFKSILRNKSKVIISVVFIIILIIAILLSNNLKSETKITSLAGNILNAKNSEVVQKTSGGGLESAYIEWESVDGATGYNVYIHNEESDNYEQIDNELIRRYKDGTSSYWRADAVGLKEGKYTFKIVPIVNNQEDTSKQFESESITVESHDRTGFAWVNGETTGAYNMDGTLKENANIIYITEETKDTVSLEVQTSSNGKTETAQGLQNILNLYKKGYEDTPLVIRFIGKVTDPSTLDGGDIVISGNSSDKRINCGITLEGIGEDATLYGYGIRIKNATNVEIRNIAVMLTDSDEGDNIGLQQENDHIWVHNCDFFYGEAGSDSDQAKGDGALDCKKSTYVTFSYNHFWDSGKSNLLGLSEDTTEGLYITYHHNWYDHSDSRHPRIRFYSAHVYNNYYDGNSKYGVGACLGSSVLVEGNYFRNCKKPMMISMQGSDTSGTFSKEDGGMIKAYNNYMIGQDSYIPYSKDNESFDAYEVSSIDEKVPDSVTSLQGENTYNNFDTSSIMYTYEADSPEQAKEKVERYAGRLNGGDFKWKFNDSEDDESDALNKELKNALENYETKLLSVGGNSIDSPEQPDPEEPNPDPEPEPEPEPEPKPEPEEIKVESIALNIQDITLEVGKIATLQATITPDNATNKNVTWNSDNTDVATVNNGAVTAVGEGTANITVTTQDENKTATCRITVLPKEEPEQPDPEGPNPEPEPEPKPEPEEIKVESIALNIQDITLEVGKIATLQATITPDNATNKNVTWSSDNTDVATVNNGVVTAVGEGTANITVTTQDGNKTATCRVTVIKEVEEIISTISYNITELTNKNVIASITFNKNDVTITNNEGSNQYIFDKNGEFTFEYVDAEGNTGTNIAKVNWIDKEVPEINVEYENINNGEAVNVIIQSNEELIAIDGWTLSDDRLSMSKIFYRNQTETVEISDLVGNVIETTIHVDNLGNQSTTENQTQNNVNTNTTLENTNAHVDNTVASKVLPATGITTIIKVLIAVVLVGMMVFYIRYKNIKDLIK